MRIAGASTTRGAQRPQPRRQAAGLGAGARHRDACARRAGRRRTTRARRAARRPAPTTVTGGRAAGLLARSATSPASRARTRWSGSVPRSTIARGLVGRAAARRSSRSAMRGSCAHAHVEDERPGEARRAPPSRSAVSGLSGSSWPVTNATALAIAALGDRDPGVGRRGDARGHAGHDLERRRRARAQRLRLLAAAAEDERVAALEAHDGAPGRRVLDAAAALVSSWGTCSPPPTLPTSTSSASARRVRERLGRDRGGRGG